MKTRIRRAGHEPGSGVARQPTSPQWHSSGRTKSPTAARSFPQLEGHPPHWKQRSRRRSLLSRGEVGVDTPPNAVPGTHIKLHPTSDSSLPHSPSYICHRLSRSSSPHCPHTRTSRENRDHGLYRRRPACDQHDPCSGGRSLPLSTEKKKQKKTHAPPPPKSARAPSCPAMVNRRPWPTRACLPPSFIAQGGESKKKKKQVKEKICAAADISPYPGRCHLPRQLGPPGCPDVSLSSTNSGAADRGTPIELTCI